MGLNHKVASSLLGKKPIKGDVGIEIEMETKNLGFSYPSVQGFELKIDGSLKNNGVEYVSKGPIPQDLVDKRIKDMNETLNGRGFKMFETIRASVHIHVNMGDYTQEDMLKFALCYLIIEDYLVKWCGENREGNLFCLRARDAEGIIYNLERTVNSEKLSYLNSQDIRYASINFASLFKFGSLEFRSLPTVKGLTNIKPWVDCLLFLRKQSRKYEWDNIITTFSQYGPVGFARELLGPHYDTIIKKEDDDMERILSCNMRRVQDVIYSRKL